MYYIDDTDDFVNEKDNGYASNVLLKETGDIWELREFHENVYHYGYTRKKKKGQKLGRESEASEVDKEINQRRVNYRRKQAVVDLVNCNEWKLNVWHTIAYAKNMQDITQAHKDRKNYYQRLGRFVQTGKLYKKPVKEFTPKPDFQLEAVGVIDFQDGKRRADKQGRGAIHFHQVINTPYLPQVQVIISDVYDTRSGEYRQAYLQQDGSWSLTANRYTLWFNTSREAEDYLKESKDSLMDVFHQKPRKKPLCVAALLWEHGFIDIKAVHNMRRAGKVSNVGEYMVSQYMVENISDTRLRERKAYFAIGDLEKPTFYRDPGQVDDALRELDIWKYQIDQKEIVGEYIGAMTIYRFSFHIMLYPWIRRYYENRRQGRQMTRADWAACEGEQFQPLLL